MLEKLFNPASVAVIGASTKPQKIGSLILKNIVTGGFNGEIYPINPQSTTIQNMKCYSSVKTVTNDIDVAIIAIPSTKVIEVVKECIEKEVKFLIIITAGFKEIGEQGKKLEDEIQSLIKDTPTRLIGVNCLGVISSHWNFNGSFSGSNIIKGSIAFMSQSGAFGTSALDWLSSHNIGLKYFVSIGNKTDINEIDLMSEWANDSSVKCVVGYLESIEDGISFRQLATKISKEKPFILLKPGKSEETQKAISSHTGSMTGNAEIIAQACKQSGVILVDNMQEMFDLIKLISWQPIPQNTALTIITNAGGPAVQAVDTANEQNLQLAKLDEQTKEDLLAELPVGASVENPIDILGDAKADRYEKTLSNLLRKTTNETYLTILTPQITSEPAETVVKISKLAEQSTDKTFLFSFIGGKQLTSAKALLKKNNLPNFEFPEAAIKTISHLSKYQQWKKQVASQTIISSNDKQKAVFSKINNLVQQLTQNNNPVIPPYVSSDIAKVLGIPIPESFYPKTSEEAVQIAEKLGYPVVLKLSTEKALHKTELKGVYTNLSNQQDILNAFNKLSGVGENLKISNAGGIKYIELQEQITDGLELIIGVKRDGTFNRTENRIEGFGHALIFGYGGTYTELFRDISKRMIPLSADEIYEMLKETNVYKIMTGYRGRESFDTNAVISTIVSLALLVENVPLIKEIEINPFIVTKTAGYAVDLKMIIW